MAVQQLEKLVFPEKLVQNNRTTSIDALHKKLKDLHEKLKNLEQDVTDLKSLNAVSKELINSTLLLHRDKGVKAYVACCLVDVLRLFAPDAPYSDAQIKDIFQFVLRQLTQNLKQSQSAFGASKGKNKSGSSGNRMTDIPYYTEYYYVVESLATIKSVCLIPDLEDSDGLLLEYIQGMFSIARPLQMHMVDIYNEHARSMDEEDVASLQEAHSQIVLLFEHCSKVLLQVFPQLEETLQHDNVQVRVLSTNTLSTIFGLAGKYNLGVGSTVSHTIYRSTWEAWLKRRTDKAVAVRIAWVTGTKDPLANHPELRRELERKTVVGAYSNHSTALAEKLTDVDERVRSTVCKVIGSLDYETAAHHITVATMRAVGERMLDRKPSVSEEAYRTLGRLYDLAYPQIYAKDAVAVAQFAWIPDRMFSSYCENETLATRQIIEEITAEYLLPLPDPKIVDETAWTERLLEVSPCDDNKAFTSFLSLSNLSEPGITPWEVYLRAAMQYNGGVMDEREKEITLMLDQICQYLSQGFTNPMDVERDLKEFAKANEKRSYQYFESLVKLDSGIHDIFKAKNELLKRISQQQPEVLHTFTLVCRRASIWIINRSSIPTLLQKTAGTDTVGLKAVKLLRYVSKHRPSILRTHIAELQKALSDKVNILSVEAGMQCLAQASFGDSSVKLDRHAFVSKTVDRATKMCTGDNINLAKYAARLLGQTRQTDACEGVIQNVLETFASHDSENYPACMAAVAELGRSASLMLDEHWSLVENAITEKLLPKDNGRFSISQAEEEEDEPWVDFDELSALDRAKILALKVLVNRTLYYPEGRSANVEVQSHVKRLCSVMEHDGYLSSQLQERGCLRGHLRLAAASGLLKLTISADNEKIVNNSAFENVAYVVRDLYFQVREAFLMKLRKHLIRRRNSARWNMLPFLSAHDLDEELQELGRRLAMDLLHGLDDKARMERMERPFVRLLSLISHHPDFLTSEDAPSEHEDWIHAAAYILLYVDVVATANNIAYLHYMASRLKTVADVAYPGDRLYKISDLAQAIIQHKRKVEGWPAGTYGGKQHLPSGLFASIDIERQREIARTTYLPEDYESWLFESSRKPAPRKPRVQKAKSDKKLLPQKRKANVDGKPKHKRRKRSEDDHESLEGTDSEPEVIQPRQRAAGKRQVRSIQARDGRGKKETDDDSGVTTEEEENANTDE
ncbi:hypothetical protein QFC19_008306 [Naganishia cerealis]|uniref:Uncharacterized protein n=1 Tax=Naganishia cerealis TaxID=610337 RepID=A0ACC2V2V1_9TREE|nr:hypothetical protein QFC19_008306 [Naganishia cerealis]